MSFLIYPNNFKSVHLHFGPTVKNNDHDGNFSRIIYSTKDITFNGVSVIVDLSDTIKEFHYKKIFIRFDPNSVINMNIVHQLQTIETEILEKYIDNVAKEKRRGVHSLADQLKNGCIKAYASDGSGDENPDASKSSSNLHVMLKICGVWETQEECGILHKFITC